MEKIRFAIDPSQNVILIGYPQLDRPFTFYCEGTEYRDYADFMLKHGYSNNGRRYSIPRSLNTVKQVREIEKAHDEDLASLIEKKASELIEKLA